MLKLVQGNIQVLEIEIKDIIEPQELEHITPPKVDPSKPLVISGRAPQWLYQFLAHHYHYVKILATYDPRFDGGIIIEAPSQTLIGKIIDLNTGELRDEKLNIDTKINLDVIKLGSIQIVKAEVEGGKIIEPQTLREIDWQRIVSSIDHGKPIIAYVMVPIWFGSKLAIELSNLAPWYAVYDPRLENAIVVARHTTGLKVGCKLRLKVEQVY